MNLKEEEKGGTGKSYEFALSLSLALSLIEYMFSTYIITMEKGKTILDMNNLQMHFIRSRYIIDNRPIEIC